MPTWLTIILALGGSALISLVVKDFYCFIKAGSKKGKARIKQGKQDEMREVVKSELEPIDQKITKIEKNLSTNTDGTVTLLRDRMKCSLNYCHKQGYASATDRANWHEMYNTYRELGGNHFREYVDEWKNEMDALPTKEEFYREHPEEKEN